VKEYGNKIKISKLMRKWLERNEYIGNASSDVQAEFRQLFNGANNLIYSAKMRMAMEMLKVWTKGFGEPTAEYGAGSPTPHGLPLFSIHHPYKRYSGEFRNMGSGNFLNAPLTADSLQNALDCFRTEIRGENGHRIMTAKKSYKLFVSPENENNARRILNATQSGTPSIWSGVGVNANQTNQFIWNGNTVEIVVLEFLGDRDKNDNRIGLPSMWFVLNEEPVRITRAFRKIELRPLELNNWLNEDTGSMFVGADCAKAFDHYGAEVAIFGSKGDNDVNYSY
jgi:hypothetical protein